MLELLRLEHFAGRLNETFRAALKEGDIEFVLVEARPLPAAMPGAARDPFSLVFRNTYQDIDVILKRLTAPASDKK